MQLFPEKIRNLWNRSEVRVMILLSLVLQIILIIFVNRRKLTARIWIRIIVWSAYLAADWVATVALGNLASTIGDSEDSTPITNSALQEFWAPFLLLHLGGPDTITAYSLEDSELWLRHFLGLIIQVGVVFYVFLRSWGNTALTFLTIPIFISGVIKYGERTYALMSSSSQHFKGSLPSSPDSCQDFVKYVDDQDSSEEAMISPQDGEGSSSEEAMVIPQDGEGTSSEEAMVIPQDGEGTSSEEAMVIPQDGIHTEDHYLILAYFLFNRTKFFFAEGTLNMDEQKRIYSIIKNKSTAEAFKLVAVELGFMYEVLYTKAAIVYTHLGIVLRCITFFFSVSSLVIFSTIIDTHVYPITDISISYLLLAGAVLLELYALIILLLSDWAKLWLIKLKRAQKNSLSKTLADLFQRFFGHSLSLLTNAKWWSESMGQYNLISSCLEVQPAYFGVQKLPFMGKLLKRKYLTWIDVNSDHHLQEKILGYLKKIGAVLDDGDDKSSNVRRDSILRRRGDFALRKRDRFDELTSEWCTINVEFVDSLIMWHIATDICFNDDHDDDDLDCKISKYISDYMLYLLVFHPSMLPKGIGEIRFKETSDEIIRIFKKSNQLHDTDSKSKGACQALLQNYLDLLQKFDDLLQNDENDADGFNEFFEGESQSLLKYGLMVYQQLQDQNQRKWRIISDVWVEMLVYAAHNCGWKEHAQRLRKGGELLTHICVLMAHFGFTKQYVSTILISGTPELKEKVEADVMMLTHHR